MPVTVETLVENRVILTTAADTFNLAEMEEAAAQIYSLMNAGENPVHIIADATAMNEFPLNIATIYERSTFLRHLKLGCVVLVGVKTLLLSLMIRGVAQISGHKLLMASTVSKTLELLHHYDGSIAPRTTSKNL